jgi:outer membrane protein TolC
MKRVYAFALSILLLLSPTRARSQEGKLPAEELSSLVETALVNNPELKSSESRWQMFAQKARQASALEDPMLMIKLQNLMVREPLVLNKDPQSAVVVGISQQLPFWGKRALRKEVALHEAESYRWAAEERRLELARMVKESYYQLWSVDKGLDIIDRNLKIMTDFVTITGLRYSVGQGVQQDIFKAGLEKSRMLDMQISLQQQRRSLEANLNYLLYRPANTPVGVIADFALPRLTLSAEQLYDIAMENRPQVKSLSSMVSKGQAAHRLARKEFWPDFNVAFEYMIREPISSDMATDPGYNMYSLGVTFNLPFQQQKRKAMIAESIAETSMATEELNALKNNLSYTINETLSQLERRRRMVELYREGIIPQAEQSLESALIGYRVSKVDFLTVLDGRLTLFNSERELYEAEAEYMMKIAQLEAVTGTDILSAQQGVQPQTSSATVPGQQKRAVMTGASDAHLRHH